MQYIYSQIPESENLICRNYKFQDFELENKNY